MIEVCKFDGACVRADEEFLLTTIEKVTIPKRVYTLIYNTVERSFSQSIQNLSYSKQKDIGDDFSSKNYLTDDSLTNLNVWISFYYLYGRFPCSEEFVNIPIVNKPVFLKTETNLLLANLYSTFSATDAKGLVSLHALAVLNIYFGGNQTISQTAYGEFMNNLTYQALSQENDKIFMSFEECTKLAHSIVNSLVEMEKREFEITAKINEQISDKLDIEFEAVESPAMQIQLGEKTELEKREPKQSSTPLTKEKIKEIYEKEKTDYLKIATKLHEIDLQAASEVADSENENLYHEIIDPTPGLTLDDEIDVDNKFSFRIDADTSYTLPNALKSKLENILEDARDKVNSISFTPKPVKKIPNNPLYNEADWKQKIFILMKILKICFIIQKKVFTFLNFQLTKEKILKLTY